MDPRWLHQMQLHPDIVVGVPWSEVLIWDRLTDYIWGVEPKIIVPPNHPFVHRVFHYFHHPFWGVNTPIFGNTRIISGEIIAASHDLGPQEVAFSKGNGTPYFKKKSRLVKYYSIRPDIYINHISIKN